MSTTSIETDHILAVLEGRLPLLNDRDLATISQIVDCLLYNDPTIYPADEYGEPLGDTPGSRARILDHTCLAFRD
jgi:hypothetical protein